MAWLPGVEVTTEAHPTLARHGERLMAMDFRSTYFAGLKVLIAAIASAGHGR
jgi:hypothetical protein